ncbi:MAG: hypothetical protein AAF196_08375 [Planctomycetota bacterium]
MTDELQELEPLDDQPTTPPAMPTTEAAAMAQGPGGTAAVAVSAGVPILGAPAYNPAADKEYFRFLFAGLLMFIGLMMPFGAGEYESVGYETLGGAISLFIAIGLMWSWWGSIAVNRFKGSALLWVVASLIPLLAQVNELINRPGTILVNRVLTESAFEEAGGESLETVELENETLVIVAGERGNYGLGDFFGDYTNFSGYGAQHQASQFLTQFGPGRFIVLLGALWAEIAMAMAIFGGAKTAKKQNQAAKSARAAKTDGAGDKKGGAAKGRRRR